MLLAEAGMRDPKIHKKIVTQLLKKPLMIIAQENRRLDNKEQLMPAKTSGNIEKN